MKVINVPFTFAPDPIGGTEVFVGALSRELQGLGVNVFVAAPSEKSYAYTADGLEVRRFATLGRIDDVSLLYGAGDSLATTEFAAILDQEKPDIVHLHAFTAAVSLRLVRAAKKRKVPVVFTYHTPTVSCQRGTLLLWGKAFCDGRLVVDRCAGCALNGLGVPQIPAAMLGRLPPILGHWLGNLGLQGGFWTAIRMPELISMRHAAFREMVSEVDRVVAVCDWVRELLLLNDVPKAKVTISRQGVYWISPQKIEQPPSSIEQRNNKMRLAFVGRLDPTKGLDVLIDAFRMVPALDICLDVYGIIQSAAGSEYEKKMFALSSEDPRITFCGPIPSADVVERLRHYDLLAVPSTWVETGPMVVLEAFAAGIPVLGSSLGGISEVVRDGIDGLLIQPGSVERWAYALRRLAEDPKLRLQLKAGVRPPRSSLDAARDMLALYNSILQQ
jgi:glycosyltransferase involved in cell wall biosynthesis